MPSENSCNMWVFREGRSTVSGKVLRDGLRSALRAISSHCGATRDALVDTLLRAGELECALADASASHAPYAAAITDAVAAALVGCPGWPVALEQAPALLDAIKTPEQVNISPPEGFAYYALHPLDFAALCDQVPLRGKQAAVVGIRSIGTTLSAVVVAELRRRGVRADRITVRPVGHPYDRRTTFSIEQLKWTAWRRAALADFLVTDEGPGISGSSFLSVGDALLEAGVARERITFLGSRYANPDTLTAREGASRWRSFRTLHADPTLYTPADRGAYIGGGEWRQRSFGEESQWPASWVQMERLKFLSRDGKRTYKFHGLGRFGDAAAERARLLGEAGFGPKLLKHSSGFSEFEVVGGRPMDATQISSALLERVADYCALRAVEFRVRPAQEAQLEAMVRFNIGEEFGREADVSLEALNSERLVIADGRMLPHEWLAAPGGALVKTDNATHGDDHLFPGPVDIAWDLAGAIIECGMTTAEARYMMDRYRRRSGDDPRSRIDAYLLAYAVFRMAYCGMAAFTMQGSAEEPRLRRAGMHYHGLVEAQLKSSAFSRQSSGNQNREWTERAAGVEGILALDDRGADAA
jgi:hypothetical protein